MANQDQATSKSSSGSKRRTNRSRARGRKNKSSSSSGSLANSSASSSNNTPSPTMDKSSRTVLPDSTTKGYDTVPIGFMDDQGNFDLSNNKSPIYQTAEGRQIMYLTDRAKIAATAELLADVAPFRQPYT